MEVLSDFDSVLPIGTLPKIFEEGPDDTGVLVLSTLLSTLASPRPLETPLLGLDLEYFVYVVTIF